MPAKTTSHNYVPQIILQNYARGNFNGRFSAAALFVDLSGFTALTDQLMTHGQHGAELLARLVGEIFDPLIDAVYAQSGFITGFGGDAFTAVFPDTIDLSTARALIAAVTIQDAIQARPEQETPSGRYALSAKVGVAWGEVSWGTITSEDDQQASYYFQGTAIDGCAEAESAAQPGEIIVDAASYIITSKNGTMEAVGDHYRLTSLN